MQTIITEADKTLVLLLKEAVARVEIANKEGDPILSAWLPEAKAALAALHCEMCREITAHPVNLKSLPYPPLKKSRLTGYGYL